MRQIQLSEKEKADIRAEALKQKSLDKAIIFCLGYKGRKLTEAMRETFEAVKRQL